MKKRKYLAVASLLCCFLLAACGGGEDSSTSSGNPVSSDSGFQDSGYEETSSLVTAFYVNVDYNPNNVSVEMTGEQDEYGRYEAGTRISISATLINTGYTLTDIFSEDVTFTSKEISDY